MARLLTEPGGVHHLGVLNLGAAQGQCRLPIPESHLAGCPVVLQDLLGDACYERAGDELMAPGLYPNMPSDAYRVFRIR